MELYYKNLISEDASPEKLVDDLVLVVQGADAYVKAVGVSFDKQPAEEITSRLARLKEGCDRAKAQAVSTALAAHKVVHQYPYSSVGFAFAAGLLAGAVVRKVKRET
jgi:ElaB/YqjD/DUF883 family membrane-anchored ribosome-binding protein